MSYEVVMTDTANDQLSQLIHYIAEDSGDVKIAMDYLDKIDNAITSIAEFPNIGKVPRYSVLKRQGYRVLVVEKHLIFYKVNDVRQLVVVYAIVDGRREYKNMI